MSASAATGVADVSVLKSGPATAHPGDSIAYTIVVTDNGPDDATNVNLVDSLPAGVSFTSVDDPGGSQPNRRVRNLEWL